MDTGLHEKKYPKNKNKSKTLKSLYHKEKTSKDF